MNISRKALSTYMEYYDAEVENLIVIYDDIDLPTGKIILRKTGGHGGHNGIRSLIDHLGTKEFKRLRIGIGRPIDRTPIVNYVLQPFAKVEQEAVNEAIQLASDACEQWMEQHFTHVMNEFNAK